MLNKIDVNKCVSHMVQAQNYYTDIITKHNTVLHESHGDLIKFIPHLLHMYDYLLQSGLALEVELEGLDVELCLDNSKCPGDMTCESCMNAYYLKKANELINEAFIELGEVQ